MVAVELPEKARAWRRHNLFGVHLSKRPRELISWSHGVDQLISYNEIAKVEPERLAHFFRTALEIDIDAQEHLRDELTQLLTWVSDLEDPGLIDDRRVSRLVHLANAYRTLGQDQEGGVLSDVLSDLTVLCRGRLATIKDPPLLTMTGPEIVLVEALVKELTSEGQFLQARFGQHDEMILGPVEVPEDEVRFLIRIWGELCYRIRVHVRNDSVVVTLPASVNGVRGLIFKAVEQALQPLPSTLNAAIANLLHDLKNQVVAARHAAMTRGGGRTIELERKAIASRHLDQASSLAQRIRAATSLLAPSSSHAGTRLSEFLRRYLSMKLLQLPPTSHSFRLAIWRMR
ncbi:hypothetical protein [Micromonospora zhanjiangensis]